MSEISIARAKALEIAQDMYLDEVLVFRTVLRLIDDAEDNKGRSWTFLGGRFTDDFRKSVASLVGRGILITDGDDGITDADKLLTVFLSSAIDTHIQTVEFMSSIALGEEVGPAFVSRPGFYEEAKTIAVATSSLTPAMDDLDTNMDPLPF